MSFAGHIMDMRETLLFTCSECFVGLVCPKTVTLPPVIPRLLSKHACTSLLPFDLLKLLPAPIGSSKSLVKPNRSSSCVHDEHSIDL